MLYQEEVYCITWNWDDYDDSHFCNRIESISIANLLMMTSQDRRPRWELDRLEGSLRDYNLPWWSIFFEPRLPLGVNSSLFPSCKPKFVPNLSTRLLDLGGLRAAAVTLGSWIILKHSKGENVWPLADKGSPSSAKLKPITQLLLPQSFLPFKKTHQTPHRYDQENNERRRKSSVSV